MLTAKQYEGIGRFTIAFNEIDQVVEVYLPLVVKYAQCTLPAAYRNPRTFHARAVAFRTALELASAANEIAAAYATGILKVLDRAEAIAATRNQYVHAAAFIDFQTNTRMLQMRSGDAAPDEKQITDLAIESAWLARHFAEECEALLRMYIDMNKSLEEPALAENMEATANPSQNGNRDFDRAMERVGSFTHASLSKNANPKCVSCCARNLFHSSDG